MRFFKTIILAFACLASASDLLPAEGDMPEVQQDPSDKTYSMGAAPSDPAEIYRAPDAWQLRHAFRTLAGKRSSQQAESIVGRRALN